MVACLRGGGDAVDKVVQLRADVGLAAQRGERGGYVPVHAACVAEYLVGGFQAACQRVCHCAEFHGIGARFQHGDDARAADFLPQPCQRGGDGGGVVGEVVVHGDAAHAAFDFHAPLDVFELAQRLATVFYAHADVLRGGNHG